jgi:hypothetical protein
MSTWPPFPSPFTTSSSRDEQAFDLDHCDLWTSPVLSLSGYKYYLVILDDFSHFLWTSPLRLKSDTFTTLTHFFAEVSTQFSRPVRALQCDNGREFDNHASRSFFLTSGVQLRLSCPYISAQNGQAERMIRTTTNMICCLLFQTSLPASYWTEALHTATHLLNRLPSKVVKHPTPHFALYGTTTFGCSVVPAIPTPPPLPLTSCLPAPLTASSLATLLTTRGIAVLTSPPIASSSLVMSSSTKMCFPLLAPHHPPISTPSLSLIRVPRHLASHHYPHLAQLQRPLMWSQRPHAYHIWLRHPHSHACLRQARPRRPHLRYARPRRRARPASPTPPSSTTSARALLPRRPRTRGPQRAQPTSPTPPSSIIDAARPCPWPLSRQCTTLSPFTTTPSTLTPW